jgi:cobalt-zinc-cadmium efflux system protein
LGHRITATGRHTSRLIWAFGLTLVFLILEVIGAICTGSLALLADAGHMLTDVAGIYLSLFAIWFIPKPPTPSKTYGYVRLEILAALANGVLLLNMAALFCIKVPANVVPSTGSVLAIAISSCESISQPCGCSTRGADESLNLRGVYLEVLRDDIASLGVIVAALLIQWTRWTLTSGKEAMSAPVVTLESFDTEAPYGSMALSRREHYNARNNEPMACPRGNRKKPPC